MPLATKPISLYNKVTECAEDQKLAKKDRTEPITQQEIEEVANLGHITRDSFLTATWESCISIFDTS